MLASVASAYEARRRRLDRIAKAAVPDDGIDLKRKKPMTTVVEIVEVPPPKPTKPPVVIDCDLYDYLNTTEPNSRYLTAKHIQRAVSECFKIGRLDILSRRRPADVCLARQVSMCLCKKLTMLSLPQTGRAHANRDHTTVMHAVRKIESKMAADPAFHLRVVAVIDLLRAQKFRLPQGV